MKTFKAAEVNHSIMVLSGGRGTTKFGIAIPPHEIPFGRQRLKRAIVHDGHAPTAGYGEDRASEPILQMAWPVEDSIPSAWPERLPTTTTPSMITTPAL